MAYSSCEEKECLDKLDKDIAKLNESINKVHTRLTVVEKSLFGNGRPGVFQVLECMDTVVKDLTISIKLMKSFLDNNKSVFDTKVKVVGLWLAGIGLVLNGAIGITRVIISL